MEDIQVLHPCFHGRESIVSEPNDIYSNRSLIHPEIWDVHHSGVDGMRQIFSDV